MMRFLVVFFLITTVFLFVNQKIARGQLGEIINVGGVVKDVTTKTPEEEQQEAQEETAKLLKKQIENFKNDQNDQQCNKVGEACCVYKFPTLPKIPNLKWVSGGNELQESAQSVQESTEKTTNLFSFVGCAKGLLPNNPDDAMSCRCVKEQLELSQLCKRVGDREKQACERCSGGSGGGQGVGGHGIWTALGCIDFTVGGFIQNTLLGIGVGLAGVIALLCIIYSAFTLQVSSGNPERIKKAKERLTACIIGLFLIIFSVFILQIIGVNILQISSLG